jgi:putative glutamine amidotransferase
MTRPLIGLTTYAQDTRFGTVDVPAAVLPLTYVRAVHATGGRAVLITTDDPGDDVLDGLDGIVFTGGSDVSPGYYGAEPHPLTLSVPERDEAEMLLMRGALAKPHLPILGVCRGMQLLTVASGGRLHQHVPDIVGHSGHMPGDDQDGHHGVRLAPGSRAHAILGPEAPVNSYHHQAVADPGRLVATGWADDGLIEAVEDPDAGFVLGVQWHPERTEDLRPFAALVEAARSRALVTRARLAA